MHKYIDNYKEDWEDVIKNAKFPLLQSRSDLARLLLIKKYGGVYMDITSMLIYGLKWL